MTDSKTLRNRKILLVSLTEGLGFTYNSQLIRAMMVAYGEDEDRLDTELEKSLITKKDHKDHIQKRIVTESVVKRWFESGARPDLSPFRIAIEKVFKKHKNINAGEIRTIKELEKRISAIMSNKIENIKKQPSITNSNDLTIINNDFFSNITAKHLTEEFETSDFYLALKGENCQWYGITQNWDYERRYYKELKESIEASFSSESDNNNIIAYITGLGGSGKSTLLRRLAYDLRKKDFKVLWLSDRRINDFIQNDSGVTELQKQNDHYLVIIEDWYRIKPILKDSATSLINQLSTLSNVRLVIGDRDNDKNILKHLPSLNNRIKIEPNDNQDALEQILEKIPEWKVVVDEIKNPESFNKISLYILLWCIGRLHELKDADQYDKLLLEKDLNISIIEIALSHFKRIPDEYSHIAMMLYYWACIYAKRNFKKPLSLDTFCKLADLIDGNNLHKAANAFHSEVTWRILSNYIEFDETGENITFNHDTLSDEVLCNLGKVDDSYSFELDKNIALAENVITIRAYYFIAPLTGVLYTNNPNNILLKDTKKYFINKYFEANFLSHYLDYIFTSNLYTKKEKKDWGVKILDRLFEKPAITESPYFTIIPLCLKVLDSKYSNDLLKNRDNILKLPDNTILCAMKNASNYARIRSSYDILQLIIEETNEEGQIVLKSTDNVVWKNRQWSIGSALKITTDYVKKVSGSIIQLEFFLDKLPSGIINHALKNANQEISQDICNAILRNDRNILHLDTFLKLPQELINTILRKATDTVAERVSNAILRNDRNVLHLEHFLKLPPFIITTLLRKADKDTAEGASNNILQQLINKEKSEQENRLILKALDHDIWKRYRDSICTAFDRGSEKFTTGIANNLLNQRSFLDKSLQEIAAVTLKKADAVLAQKISLDHLEAKNIDEISLSIYSTLIFKANDQTQALKIINDNDTYKNPSKLTLLHRSLGCFTSSENIPDEVFIRIDKIVSNKKDIIKYINLMKLPFHQIDIWSRANENNIRYWDRNLRILAANAILVNINYPELIYEMCSEILKKCEIEIFKEVRIPLVDKINYGNHVMLSLKHPDLREASLIAAKKLSKIDLDKLPKSMRKTILAIIDGEHPEWPVSTY